MHMIDIFLHTGWWEHVATSRARRPSNWSHAAMSRGNIRHLLG